MKDKVIIGTIVSILIALLIVQQYSIWTNTKVNKDSIFINKINKLESKIDSLNLRKDSIRIAIDSTHVKIVTNEKHYQERVNTIITQPDSYSDSLTRQYIFEYAASHGYHISGTSEIE